MVTALSTKLKRGEQTMKVENAIFASSSWICSLIFAAIAIWAFMRKEPMHFWSGTTVKPEEITDIRAYNRANGIMWGIYAACTFLSGILSFFSIIVGAALLFGLLIPGIGVLIFSYNRIYNKYKSSSVSSSHSLVNGKTAIKNPKAAAILFTLFFAGICIIIGIMSYYGELDPEIIIDSDKIRIEAMYGVDINTSEIADISLIDKSINEMGIGKRTNGYDGFGKALKGNFKSDSLGETLLFVIENSSPTIKIERIGQKDIYISLTDSDKTRHLYQQLMQIYR